jgi:hypothetical protein
MKKNKSALRTGEAKKRWTKKVRRFNVIHHLRFNAKWKWDDIGKRFRMTRQAACKFYNEHKNLIKPKGENHGNTNI